jgi:hypothetical protein
MIRLTCVAMVLAAAPIGAQCVPCAYGRAIFSPTVAATSVVGGWLDQVRDDPKTWSRDAGGFGTRIASRFGQATISAAVIISGGLLTGSDQRYHNCVCTDALPRVVHALTGPLTATTPSGRTVISPIQTIGAFAGGYTAMTWRPGRYDPVKGYQFALSAMAVTAGIDLVREIVR